MHRNISINWSGWLACATPGGGCKWSVWTFNSNPNLQMCYQAVQISRAHDELVFWHFCGMWNVKCVENDNYGWDNWTWLKCHEEPHGYLDTSPWVFLIDTLPDLYYNLIDIQYLPPWTKWQNAKGLGVGNKQKCGRKTNSMALYLHWYGLRLPHVVALQV